MRSEQVNELVGWIPLFRKSLISQVFQDADLWKVWCWCLLKASHNKESWFPMQTGIGMTQVRLQEGQFVYGRFTAAKELRMKPSSVRDRMAKLANMQNIVIKPDTHFSIVTICSWIAYRDLMFRKPTGNPTPRRQAGDTYNNGDKGNKEYIGEIKEVIDYLNLKTGKAFKDTTEASYKHIQARLREGFTPVQLKQVIDTKINDPYFKENAKYLNPETLFRPGNFEKYLNEKPPQNFGAAGRLI